MMVMAMLPAPGPDPTCRLIRQGSLISLKAPADKLHHQSNSIAVKETVAQPCLL
jgi:hypothetical protein